MPQITKNFLLKLGIKVKYENYCYAFEASKMKGAISLGNFISSMQYQVENGNDRDLGAIASVTLKKSKDTQELLFQPLSILKTILQI